MNKLTLNKGNNFHLYDMIYIYCTCFKQPWIHPMFGMSDSDSHSSDQSPTLPLTIVKTRLPAFVKARTKACGHRPFMYLYRHITGENNFQCPCFRTWSINQFILIKYAWNSKNINVPFNHWSVNLLQTKTTKFTFFEISFPSEIFYRL